LFEWTSSYWHSSNTIPPWASISRIKGLALLEHNSTSLEGITPEAGSREPRGLPQEQPEIDMWGPRNRPPNQSILIIKSSRYYSFANTIHLPILFVLPIPHQRIGGLTLVVLACLSEHRRTGTPQTQFRLEPVFSGSRVWHSSNTIPPRSRVSHQKSVPENLEVSLENSQK
jgi:hypothetical protein